MRIYKNLSGNSAIAAFETGPDYIIVRFKEGEFKEFTYDYAKAGYFAVETMKHLAMGGKGLSTYIHAHMRDKYSKAA